MSNSPTERNAQGQLYAHQLTVILAEHERLLPKTAEHNLAPNRAVGTGIRVVRDEMRLLCAGFSVTVKSVSLPSRRLEAVPAEEEQDAADRQIVVDLLARLMPQPPAEVRRDVDRISLEIASEYVAFRAQVRRCLAAVQQILSELAAAAQASALEPPPAPADDEDDANLHDTPAVAMDPLDDDPVHEAEVDRLVADLDADPEAEEEG